MKISVCSDLHVDFYTTYEVNKLLKQFKEAECNYHFIAGDTANSMDTARDFISNLPKDKTVWTVGNHEFYDGKNEPKDNLQSFELEGLKIVVGTLWTDFNHMNPLTVLKLREYMNDSAKILNYNEENLARIHKNQIDFIFDNQPDVVMTHHAVTPMSLHPRYKGTDLDFGYMTDYTIPIEDSKIKLWITGHTHHRTDFMIGNTRMISNPRGYNHEENNFKLKVIEL